VTPITLFYSWQSDRDAKLCRHFIEKALERAVELLAAEGITLTIDADTRNVPGTPPISATILKKIEACDIFLADMTFVAATDGGKLTPNPNVMGEYGYALHALGHERIMLAMNTAFGPPEELPFDLKHQRFPLQYDAPADIQNAPRRELRIDFGRKLAAAIVPIAEAARAAVQRADADSAVRARKLAMEHRAAFMRGNTPAIVSRPCLSIQIAPLAAFDGAALTPRAVAPLVERFLPPRYQRARHGADERMWWASDPPRPVAGKPNPEVDWLFTVARPGVLQFAVCLGKLIDDDPRIAVEGLQLEAWIVRMTERLLQEAETLGLSGPAVIDVGCEGIDDIDVFPGRLKSIRVRRETIQLNGPVVALGATPVGTQLRNVLDDFWLAIGRGAGSPSFPDDHWQGYDDLPDYRL
jgi:hypothetical protein